MPEKNHKSTTNSRQAAGRSKKSEPKAEKTLIGQMADATASLSKSAMKSIASRAGSLSFKVGKSIILSADQLKNYSPEQQTWMIKAGEVIHDARQVAGLTVDELSDVLDLDDKTLLQAVEQGSATLSFDLIVRLTALLARHDPIPFVVSVIRGYNPQLWAIMEDWGFGQLPTMVERDRQWINIYRSRDEARQLSDAEFERVLDFTRSAFEMALEFARQEKQGRSQTEE